MMLAWFRNPTRGPSAAERAERASTRDHGNEAHSEARRCEREAFDHETTAQRRIALIVASMTGKRVGVDAATRMLQRGDE
jgi:hypothetical protein